MKGNIAFILQSQHRMLPNVLSFQIIAPKFPNCLSGKTQCNHFVILPSCNGRGRDIMFLIKKTRGPFRSTFEPQVSVILKKGGKRLERGFIDIIIYLVQLNNYLYHGCLLFVHSTCRCPLVPLCNSCASFLSPKTRLCHINPVFSKAN